MAENTIEIPLKAWVLLGWGDKASELQQRALYHCRAGRLA
ncbi:hypothetical protein PC116_g29272 [Phytophthora cactorum]|nr:hypothetical protein PC116_g29272 [Phytophthora cactorum]